MAERGASARRAELVRAAELGLWWIGGLVFWLATVASITLPEAVIAALAAAVGAVLARSARRAMGFRVRPRLVWLRWASMVPVAVVADLGRLVVWLRHPSRSGDRAERLFPGSGRPAQVGWRAAAMIAVSATPGSVVFDADPVTGRVRLHSLVQGPPSIDRLAERGSARQARDQGV